MKPEPGVFVALVQEGEVRYDFPKQHAAYVRQFEGDEIEVIVRKRRAKRTSRQNRALWALLTEWARERGHNVNDLKDDVLGETWGWSETRSPLSGRQMPNRDSTSALNVADFCELIDSILVLAAGDGVVLLAPDEFLKAREVERKKAASTTGAVKSERRPSELGH